VRIFSASVVLLAWSLGLTAVTVTQVAATPLTDPAPAAAVLAEWRFQQPSQLHGWQPNADLQNVHIEQGALQLRATGADPILEYQPSLDLPAHVWDVFEVRLRADRDGVAELFWSNTRTGRYGGFSQAMSTRFPVRGDNAWHTYRIRPGWHPQERIVRLRFDLYDATQFAIESFRILAPQETAPPVAPAFAFTSGSQGWRADDGAEVRLEQGTLVVRTCSSAGFIASPPVSFTAEEKPFVCVQLSTRRGQRATLLFATADRPELQRFSFPIQPDGRPHLYNVDMMACRAWQGRILALGLRPTDDPQAETQVAALGAWAQPQGPAILAISSLDLEETSPRLGQRVTLLARIQNVGGQPITACQPELLTSGSLQIKHADLNIPTLAPGESAELRWTARATSRTKHNIRLRLTGPNFTPVQTQAVVHFAPALRQPAPYLPEPQPVRGKLEVGAYYFPGWKTAAAWQPIRSFPERRPALGWYEEGDPTVADWQIRWAAEHGITFFIYDWYWVRGARQLEHGLHDGYFRAPHHHLLKFCLLWANHNPPGTSSRDDCLAVTHYWIENYFRKPEHMTVDGKPLLVLFAPQRLEEDLGVTEVRPTLDAMRAECVRAGLPGLYIVACVGDAGHARHVAGQGYDAVTAYTWPNLELPAGERRAPYATLLSGYRHQWQHIAESAGIPLLPPVNGGWDSRPWHGENDTIRTDRTPALFRQHVLDARRFVERADPAQVRPILLVEAWNEWGEGAYIEPNREHGFGYLDALREALVDRAPGHVDATPADVLQTTPQVTFPDPQQRAWDFDRDPAGWSPLMNLADLGCSESQWHLRTTAVDPALGSPPLNLRANEVTTIRVRLRLTPDQPTARADQGQIYWTTRTIPESGASGVTFPVRLDGVWHEYDVPVATNARWRGQVVRLRLDPCEQPNVRVDLDWLRLLSPATPSTSASPR